MFSPTCTEPSVPPPTGEAMSMTSMVLSLSEMSAFCVRKGMHVALEGGRYDPAAPVLDKTVGHVRLADGLALDELEGIQVFHLDGFRRLHAEAVRQDQRLVDRFFAKGVLDLIIDEDEDAGAEDDGHAQDHQHDLRSYAQPVKRTFDLHGVSSFATKIIYAPGGRQRVPRITPA
jgi:hypothetical protein